jgi:uncharacterized membrane protein
MTADPRALVAILLMAVATYATRAGGLWLAGRLDLSGRAGEVLEYVPGAILISIAAPAVLESGLAGILAAFVVVITALRTGSLLAAMTIGIVAILTLRALVG